MTKTIDTLVPDIQDLFKQGILPNGYKVEYFIDFAADCGKHVASSIEPAIRAPRRDNIIYASELGTNCPRQLAYKIYEPEKAEKLHYSAKVKFLYGHMIESMALLLARLAGHDVSMEQALIETRTPNGNVIRGRIDAVIDGEVVDVKSASSIAFDKMNRKQGWDDPFGYLWQLGYYTAALNKKGRFLLVNKVTGAIGESELPLVGYSNIANYTIQADIKLAHVTTYRENSSVFDVPSIAYPELHSKGSILSTTCSYCPFKFDCWKESNEGTGLRVFLYHKGPLYFTDVKSSDKTFLGKEVTHLFNKGSYEEEATKEIETTPKEAE